MERSLQNTDLRPLTTTHPVYPPNLESRKGGARALDFGACGLTTAAETELLQACASTEGLGGALDLGPINVE